MGWIGSKSELNNVLATFGADKDEKGVFIVRGQLSSFMGEGVLFIVGDDAEFFQHGNPIKLAWALSKTSHGSSVAVIS